MKLLALICPSLITLVGCAPSSSDPQASAIAPDAAAPSGCPAKTNGPTLHDGTAIAAGSTETWTADASPHLVTFDKNIEGTLNLEPCAEVLIAPSYSLIVRDGKLVGRGTAARPIHIGASDKTQPFKQIRQLLGAGQISLAYTTIDGGGDPGSSVPQSAAMIDAQGVSGTPPTQATLDFDHVTVAGSASQGLYVHDGAGFSATSQELTVSGSADYPIAIWERAAGTLPTGSYLGNAKDAVLLDPTGIVMEDTTLHDRGVPYVVGTPDGSLSGDLRVAGSAGLATLTIEPGVTLRFAKDGWLQLESQADGTAAGALVAIGSADKPITFSADQAAPAAGDWNGVYIYGIPAPQDRIDHAVVEYAGAVTGVAGGGCPTSDGVYNNAAIRFLGPGSPGAETVTNTAISYSASNGIDCGWTGSPIDFTATNTFKSIATCLVTFPEPAPPDTCPTTPPCPQ